MKKTVIPAKGGKAVEVPAGRPIRITTPQGRQAADFFAYNAADCGEWLSPPHTWVWNRSIKPAVGQTFLSRFRRPLLDFVEDGAGGVHDMMIAACDQFRYEQLGFEGPHPSCAENLLVAMRRLGHEVSVVPQPVNLFTHTRVEADGALNAPPNPVPPGAYVVFEARIDLICVVSSCPFDLSVANWSINAPEGPSELIVEVG